MATIIDYSELIFCACGCGQKLQKYLNYKPRKFIAGHAWRGKKHKSETKQKLSEFRKGKFTGEDSYWFGKHLPKEVVDKQKQTKKERYVKEKHPMYGKKHTEETKQKIALAHTKPDDERAAIFINGYKYIVKSDHPNARKDGYIGEHVFVMSEYLGRPLKKGEHSHHINRNRSDNRIENLKLFTNSEHMSEHMKEYWKNKKNR